MSRSARLQSSALQPAAQFQPRFIVTRGLDRQFYGYHRAAVDPCCLCLFLLRLWNALFVVPGWILLAAQGWEIPVVEFRWLTGGGQRIDTPPAEVLFVAALAQAVASAPADRAQPIHDMMPGS